MQQQNIMSSACVFGEKGKTLKKTMMPTAIAEQEKLFTVEEYFELEKHSEIRHEYHYGSLSVMLGDSKIANS
jgi:hypothetical protein